MMSQLQKGIQGMMKGGDADAAKFKILAPSLKGQRSKRPEPKPGQEDLAPCQELQDSDSAVTCIAFGQERQHRNYILLAAASKDGTVVLYRCYRTEMEIQMLKQPDKDGQKQS